MLVKNDIKIIVNNEFKEIAHLFDEELYDIIYKNIFINGEFEDVENFDIRYRRDYNLILYTICKTLKDNLDSGNITENIELFNLCLNRINMDELFPFNEKQEYIYDKNTNFLYHKKDENILKNFKKNKVSCYSWIKNWFTFSNIHNKNYT